MHVHRPDLESAVSCTLPWLAFAAVALLAAGCAPTLHPVATIDQQFIRDARGLRQQLADIDVAVLPVDAPWRDDTPEIAFDIRIANHRDTDLPLRIADFALVDAAEARHRPLPPGRLLSTFGAEPGRRADEPPAADDGSPDDAAPASQPAADAAHAPIVRLAVHRYRPWRHYYHRHLHHYYLYWGDPYGWWWYGYWAPAWPPYDYYEIRALEAARRRRIAVFLAHLLRDTTLRAGEATRGYLVFPVDPRENEHIALQYTAPPSEPGAAPVTFEFAFERR